MSLEKEIQIKAALLTEGVNAEPEALAGLGELYKEQNHGLFGWDFENHEGELLPDDFRLPGGTVVQFRKNSRSPYVVKKESSGLVLTKGEEIITGLEWLKRPDFYSCQTSDGVPMTKVAQIGGEDNFFVCYNNFCSHWLDKKQCLFCNLVTTKKTYRSVLSSKKLHQIGEAAQAAFAEGAANHVLLTGGCYPGEDETVKVCKIIKTIREYTGLKKVPGCLLASPPPDLQEIERIYESGIGGIGYSLEIWDRRLFSGICPGKDERPGYDKFLETLTYAADVFGRGNVFCAFVTGIEPRDSLLEGVEFMARRGIYSLCFIWSPAPGSRLEGHRTPGSDWYVETNKKIAGIFEKYELPPTPNHCYRCDGNTLFHDAVRLRMQRNGSEHPDKGNN